MFFGDVSDKAIDVNRKYLKNIDSDVSDDAIEVGSVDLEARANSGQHHTEK